MLKLSLCAVGAGCILAAASLLPRNVESGVEPRTVQRQSVSIPNLYADTCAKCHGTGGEGGGAGTKTLNTVAKYDQSNDRPYFDAIKNGVPDMGMEAYGSTMTDEEIWGLVVYIRELQYKALRSQGVWFKKTADNRYKSKYHDYRIETVIDAKQGLETPWAIDWLPDGKMLVTNRPGPVYVFEGGKRIAEIAGIPESLELGQGGMMDVAVHPDYAKNGWIYLAYTEPSRQNRRAGLTKIVRGKLTLSGDSAKWHSQETIFEADQKFYTGAGIHFGSRIVFDGKGHIFFVVGERGGNMLAQQLDNPFGKIYRLNDDGTAPSDNPFVAQAAKNGEFVKGIWSYGHRNPQGLTFDLQGKLWDTEHGPRGGDEVNEIVKAANYGWPVVAFSINYSGAPFRTPWPKAGQDFKMPVFRWLPSIGACGLDTVRGTAFPKWRGDLVAGGLSGANVDRLRIKEGKLVEREELLWGMGRVREVTTGPDGFIYVALNQPDIVVRIVPN